MAQKQKRNPIERALRKKVAAPTSKAITPSRKISRDPIQDLVIRAVAGVGAGERSVEGQIFFDHGLPADGVTLRLYNRGFGGEAVQVSESKTDAKGFYVMSYGLSGKAANLEVRAVDAKGKETSLSATKFAAETREVMNLVVPDSVRPLAPEYERLAADLGKELGGLKRLADAREDTERQDLTLLHQATGWDARLIALAATAAKLSGNTGMSQEVHYALARVGLPTDKERLAHIGKEMVDDALKKARAVGIVKLSDQQIAGATTVFEKFARTTRLDAKAAGSLSSFRELLARSGVDDADKGKFEEIYLAGNGAADDLWKAAKDNGVSEKGINRLRLQGKLAYLTFDNAELAHKLQQEIGSAENLSQLVDKDLFQSDSWKERLNKLAGTDEQALDKLIPPAFVGKTAERLDAYAAELAQKVRLSFPTQVIGRLIEKGEVHIAGDTGDLGARVSVFLKKAGELDFELGRVPVEAFARQNREKLFAKNVPAQEVEATIQGAKQLQRLYQITPTDEALKIVSKSGIKSAQDVVAFSYEAFIKRYGDKLSSPDQAALVYRKAEQVSAVTRNLVTIAKQIDNAPSLYGVSAPAEQREQAKNNLIKHFPTMESLFGSLDFCECEHCRSVLSPAAYLVDLLQFLDPDKNVWNSAEKTPFEALTVRRPDLPNLPLTCENTNTSLPYIDVVNEILEYHIANGKLDDKAAHDTGEATTPELLAEPQNILSAAYGKLKDARYPLALPFDLSLETVRRFCDQFEMPLWQVLETFRPADELFPPSLPSPKPYYRAAVFAEYLGIAPAEYALLTNPDPLPRWFELYGYDNSLAPLTVAKDGDGQRIDLNSAKAVCRRLDISYQNLVDLVRTRFINPQLDKLVALQRLGLDARDVFRYKKHPKYEPFSADEQAAVEKRLGDLTEEFNPSHELTGFDAKRWLDTNWPHAFDQILVLADPNAGCNFDETTLRYANTEPADALVFIKINLFVRLWKKLDWPVEELDQALQVFLPQSSLPLTGANLGAAFKTALVYLAHLKALDKRLNVGKYARLKLLTVWSNLSTAGKYPLYAQLFLTPSVLKNDRVFDDPLGNYLSKPDVSLSDHVIAVQGALNLTGDEVGRILDDNGKHLDTAMLSLENVSLLYRYGLLAKGLSLSIRDLIALRQLAGLNPFAPLEANPLATLAEDHPFVHTLRFVEIVEKVRASGFKIEDLDYLLRHRFDSSGQYRSSADAPLALVKSLAAEMRRIQAENATPEVSTLTNDDFLREKLALVYPPDVVNTFFSYWNDTIEFSEKKEGVAPDQKLDPFTYQVDGIRVAYDATRQSQRVVHAGLLTIAGKNAIRGKTPLAASASQGEKDAHRNFTELLDALVEQCRLRPKEFFDKYLEGFLTYDDLYGAGAAALAAEEKRARVLGKILPFVRQKLARQLVVQALSTNLNADAALTEALLTDDNLLKGPLLSAYTTPGRGIAATGVTAELFASPDLAGNPLHPAATVAAVNLPATTGVKSARFRGYIEVPAAGAYRFFARFWKSGAEAEFRLDLPTEQVVRYKATQARLEVSEPGDFFELKPGVLYEYALEVRNLQETGFEFLVSGEAIPKDHLEQLALYPYAVVDGVRRAYVLLAKTLQLTQTLGLTEREVRHFLTHGADFDHLDLSKLPTSKTADSPADVAAAVALFGQWLRLADYVVLKHGPAGGTDDLIGIFEKARYLHAETDDKKATAAHFEPAAQLTARDAASVQATFKGLGFAITVRPDPAANGRRVETPDLAQEKGVGQLWDALRIVEKLGIAPEVVIDATRIVATASTPQQQFDIARNLRNTVKARYEPENWQRIAQPIFDKLRQRQRDALVAYILHQEKFERVEQLFEYFLIDPGMEPVVQTSRLRLAISSVQLFIQRCLLNLEEEVRSSAINSEHWQWMKRYRVWEANRKIFLFPENYLDPEFRDDKTHLYQELESALLQGDVSNDLADDAFFKYLKKLEELARLDIVTMYCEEKSDAASNILHVVGRTHNLPHKYFYRRFAHGMWTPWEPVVSAIEGDHVVAVVWRQRLHLFWVKFLQRAKQVTSGVPLKLEIGKELPIPTAVQMEVEILLHWSEYFQGQWTTLESSALGSSMRADVGNEFDARSVFIHADKEYEGGQEGAVKINLGGSLNKAFRIVNKNSHPEIGEEAAPQVLPYLNGGVRATQYKGPSSNKLMLASPEPIERRILQLGDEYSLLTNTFVGWSPWQSLGAMPVVPGVTIAGTNELAAVSWGNRRIDLFALGQGSDLSLHLVHKSHDTNGWSPVWEDLGSVNAVRSAPAACSWGPGRLDVFLMLVNQDLVHKWYDTNGWSDWESLGSASFRDYNRPAAVSWGHGRIDLFALSSDVHLMHKVYDTNGWSAAWEDLGAVPGGPVSDLSVCSWGPGRLDVFLLNQNRRLAHKWYDTTGWSDWESLGGVLTTSPAAASWGQGRIDVFAFGEQFDIDPVTGGGDADLMHKWYDANGWSAWESLAHGAGSPYDQPSACSSGPEHVEVFAQGRGGPWTKGYVERSAAVISPFFYQDNQHTFFVEPALVDIPIKHYEKFGIGVLLDRPLVDESYRKKIPIKVEIPVLAELVPIDPRANFKIKKEKDWLTGAETVLQFDEHSVGRGGGLDSAVLTAVAASDVSYPINR